jgi:hypothetical protein
MNPQSEVPGGGGPQALSRSGETPITESVADPRGSAVGSSSALARVAWHEATHAVAAFLVGWHVENLEMMPGCDPAGVCWMRCPEKAFRGKDWDWILSAQHAFTIAAPMLLDPEPPRTCAEFSDANALRRAALSCFLTLDRERWQFRYRIDTSDVPPDEYDDHPAVVTPPKGFDTSMMPAPPLIPEGTRVLVTGRDVRRVEAAFMRAAHHEVVVRCADNVTRVARALLLRPDLKLGGRRAREIASPFKPFTYRTFLTALRRAGFSITEAS